VADLRAKDVVAMAIHDVQPDDIALLAETFGVLAARDVVDAAIHGVEAGEAASFAARRPGATLRDLIARSIHGDDDEADGATDSDDDD
jgi:hypothetical protein